MGLTLYCAIIHFPVTAMLNKKTLIVSVAALVAAAASAIYFAPHSGNSLLHQLTAKINPTHKAATSVDWKASISEFAGAGVSGSLNGTALTSQFSDPFGVVIDHHGNVVVSDAGDNNQIRRITPDGIVSVFAGTSEGYVNGAAASAAFNTPSGLAVDADDNLYVADTGNNVIRKISSDGIVSTLAGNGHAGYQDGGAAQAEFNGPIGIAVDAGGNVLVADTYNDRIRIILRSGRVTTMAGSGVPGYLDGAPTEARFDTPCALAVSSKGEVLVADTKNNALRVIATGGQVTTLYRNWPDDKQASFRRPVSLALTADDLIYVGTIGGGQLFQFSGGGAIHSLNDAGSDLSISRQVQIPYGLALTAHGELLVTDAPAFMIRKVEPQFDAPDPVAALAHNAPRMRAVLPSSHNFLWPVAPQHVPHEIVGTIGEDRGNDKGESRDHFHAGVDVRANFGTTVLAVAAGKVTDPVAAWGFGNLSEGLSIGVMSYIHMRVGRNEKNELLDPARFIVVVDDQNKSRIRVKRGTRFASGDALGSVNRMFHVHLEYSPFGEQVNPLMLGLRGYADHIAPTIEHIELRNTQGKIVNRDNKEPLRISGNAGNLTIVVSAYDQSNGNDARRRLGLYQIGYQILKANGQPVSGYEKPVVNIEFNQVPDDKAIKIAYAEGSGETVHGNKVTEFLYEATNKVRDGVAQYGFWNPSGLPRGDYLIRIFAADFAGNIATSNRDLAVKVE